MGVLDPQRLHHVAVPLVGEQVKYMVLNKRLFIRCSDLLLVQRPVGHLQLFSEFQDLLGLLTDSLLERGDHGILRRVGGLLSWWDLHLSSWCLLGTEMENPHFDGFIGIQPGR
jgi:hypothetical protein